MTYKLVARCFILWLSLIIAMPMHGVDDIRMKAYNVSLIRIIANPKLFDERRIRVAGYLDYNGLDKAIGVYVSEVDARNSVSSNSIDLHIDNSAGHGLLGEYVIFDGTFHAPTGVLAEYTNGYIDHVSGMRSWNRGDTPK